MKPIGGYFELELGTQNIKFPHAKCKALNSGRHALEYILLQLREQVSVIHVPYYTCDVVLEPLKRLNIAYRFYHINENLEVENIPTLSEGHFIIVNNYFGLKDQYINKLYDKLGQKLIVDNAQAFYAKERKGMNAFFSPRKFVGVPDGGFALCTKKKEIKLEQDYSTDRSSHLLRRIDCGASCGYKEFKNNSNLLSEQPMKRISTLSSRILQSINFKEAKYQRIENFKILHETLSHKNRYTIPEIESFECPMVYPYRTKNLKLRERLIFNGIFVASYWPNVRNWCNISDMEYRLLDEILPLPIDQRYGESDMRRIIQTVKLYE